MLAGISTGSHSRNCFTCGTPFVGLGALCPVHLGQHARERSAEIRAERTTSAAILAAREQADRKPRTEIPDELDAEEIQWRAAERIEDEAAQYGPQEPPQGVRIFNRRQPDGTYRPLSEFFDTQAQASA